MSGLIILALVIIILCLLIDKEQTEALHTAHIEALNDQKRKILDDIDKAAVDIQRGGKR